MSIESESNPPEPETLPLAGLAFADAAGLEFDEQIAQLIARARDVSQAQNRLKGLLRANEAIIGDLALPVVLRRIVEAACQLVGARYGALGVIGAGKQLEQFIHVGLAAEQVRKIGPLPAGKGLLGALIDDPQPIRLAEIRDDDRSAGFPAEHPPMNGFLGVPVRVRDTIFGNLYLTERIDGQEFTAADEELVLALAATAGVAIENARLFEETKLRQRWLQVSTEITRQLLTGQGEDPLQVIATRVMEIADADVVTVVLPVGDGARFMVEVAVGAGAQQLTALTFAAEDSYAGEAFRTGQPRRLDSIQGGEFPLHLQQAMPIGTAMVIPLVGANGVRGSLNLGRRPGGPEFSAAEVEMVTMFANHAALALELSDARADQQRFLLLEDRERIARDLHDHVIQRLFGIGLAMQSVGSILPAGETADRLLASVDDVDATIRQIRTTIFELSGPLMPGTQALRQRTMQVVNELEPILGLQPRVTFIGPVDFALTAEAAEDVLAVLREGLTNVARHAAASIVEVDITAADDEFRIEVTDNGIGIGSAQRRSGLANLRQRAERRGGGLTLDSTPGRMRLGWMIRTDHGPETGS